MFISLSQLVEQEETVKDIWLYGYLQERAVYESTVPLERSQYVWWIMAVHAVKMDGASYQTRGTILVLVDPGLMVIDTVRVVRVGNKPTRGVTVREDSSGNLYCPVFMKSKRWVLRSNFFDYKDSVSLERELGFTIAEIGTSPYKDFISNGVEVASKPTTGHWKVLSEYILSQYEICNTDAGIYTTLVEEYKHLKEVEQEDATLVTAAETLGYLVVLEDGGKTYAQSTLTAYLEYFYSENEPFSKGSMSSKDWEAVAKALQRGYGNAELVRIVEKDDWVVDTLSNVDSYRDGGYMFSPTEDGVYTREFLEEAGFVDTEGGTLVVLNPSEQLDEFLPRVYSKEDVILCTTTGVFDVKPGHGGSVLDWR